MTPDAISVFQAFVFDDASSRFLRAIQHSAERPWFRVDDRIVHPRFVTHRSPALFTRRPANPDLRALKTARGLKTDYRFAAPGESRTFGTNLSLLTSG
jgi:hypothetical protein